MLDVNELKGRIVKCGLSQRKIARMLNMTEKTFYCKMRAGVFRTDELERIAELIGLQREDIGQLFCNNPEVS